MTILSEGHQMIAPVMKRFREDPELPEDEASPLFLVGREVLRRMSDCHTYSGCILSTWRICLTEEVNEVSGIAGKYRSTPDLSSFHSQHTRDVMLDSAIAYVELICFTRDKPFTDTSQLWSLWDDLAKCYLSFTVFRRGTNRRS